MTTPSDAWKSAAEQTLQRLHAQRAMHRARLEHLREQGQGKARAATGHAYSILALDAAIADHEHEMLRAAAVKATGTAA